MKMEISEWISVTFIWIFNILIITSDGSHSHFSNYDEEPIPFSLRLTEASCSFPSRWEGNWFQSGVHLTITINRTGISSKGRCVEADGDKFIVYNPLDSCYRCVVFHEKHFNVLQYKETFCNSDPDGLSLQRICRTIPGDAHLYSMFRLEAESIPCPFQGPFSFSYSRGPGQGMCQYPVSTIDTCIQSSRLVLNYQACHDMPWTESTVEELECLASWKEGSSRYMVGLLQYAHPSSFEDRFRCFVYEKGNKFGSPGSDVVVGRSNHSTSDMDRVIFRVAQSGDATCLGLTPYEGSKILTLRRGASSLSKACVFPAWLQAHAQWFTLNGKVRYSFESTSLRIVDGSSEASTTLLTTATCVQLKEIQAEKLTIILRSTTECEIGYKCLVVHRREGHVIELQMGKSTRESDSACHYSYFDDAQLPHATLTSPTPESRQCPYEGQFDITSLSTGKNFHSDKCDLLGSSSKLPSSFFMGCASLDSVHLNTQCSSAPRISEEYTCNAWWEDGGESYLVATSVSQGNPRFCFKIREIILELSPQEVRKKELTIRDSYESSSEEEARDLNSRKIFQFFLSSETCSRKAVHSGGEMDLRFNASNFDNCNGVNSGEHIRLSRAFEVTLLTVLLSMTRLWS